MERKAGAGLATREAAPGLYEVHYTQAVLDLSGQERKDEAMEAVVKQI
jgi:hypothetical protein